MAPAVRAKFPGPEGQGSRCFTPVWLCRVPARGQVKPIFSGTVWSFIILVTIKIPSLDQEEWGRVTLCWAVSRGHRDPQEAPSCCSHSRTWRITSTMRYRRSSIPPRMGQKTGRMFCGLASLRLQKKRSSGTGLTTEILPFCVPGPAKRRRIIVSKPGNHQTGILNANSIMLIFT